MQPIHTAYEWLNQGIQSNLVASFILALWARSHFKKIHRQHDYLQAKLKKVHKDVKEI